LIPLLRRRGWCWGGYHLQPICGG